MSKLPYVSGNGSACPSRVVTQSWCPGRCRLGPHFRSDDPGNRQQGGKNQRFEKIRHLHHFKLLHQWNYRSGGGGLDTFGFPVGGVLVFDCGFGRFAY